MGDDPALEPMGVEDAAHVGWIDAHWAALAAFAWQRYVSEGRGVVLLADDDHGLDVVGYETAGTAAAAGAPWPDELHAAIEEYHPVTEVLFLVEPEGDGTLIGLRATPPCVSPWETGQEVGAAPVVRSA